MELQTKFLLVPVYLVFTNPMLFINHITIICPSSHKVDQLLQLQCTNKVDRVARYASTYK